MGWTQEYIFITRNEVLDAFKQKEPEYDEKETEFENNYGSRESSSLIPPTAIIAVYHAQTNQILKFMIVPNKTKLPEMIEYTKALVNNRKVIF